MHSGAYAYRDRRDKKGQFRRLWIIRIGAAARQNGLTYSQLIHGLADRTVRPADGRRLAAAAGTSAEHWEVSGADHGAARAADPAAWDARVSGFLRRAFLAGREAVPIIGRPAESANVP